MLSSATQSSITKGTDAIMDIHAIFHSLWIETFATPTPKVVKLLYKLLISAWGSVTKWMISLLSFEVPGLYNGHMMLGSLSEVFIGIFATTDYVYPFEILSMPATIRVLICMLSMVNSKTGQYFNLADSNNSCTVLLLFTHLASDKFKPAFMEGLRQTDSRERKLFIKAIATRASAFVNSPLAGNKLSALVDCVAKLMDLHAAFGEDTAIEKRTAPAPILLPHSTGPDSVPRELLQTPSTG